MNQSQAGSARIGLFVNSFSPWARLAAAILSAYKFMALKTLTKGAWLYAIRDKLSI